MDRRRLQALLLRLTGSVEMLAFGAVVMPRAWMEAGHRLLGLGEMPPGPLIDSLTRGLSFTYGLHGVALWLIASDVVRYRPLVLLAGAGYLLAGPVLFLIDVAVGMPAFWVAGNGGACLPVGTLVLWAAWGSGDAGPAAATGQEGRHVHADRSL
jgi:hypothetical protein